MDPPDDGGLSNVTNYNRTVLMANQNGNNSNSVGLAELTALAELTGTSLDPRILVALVEVQSQFRDKQAELSKQLEIGKVTREQYLDRVNSLIRDAMDHNLKVLGQDRFKKLFGQAGFQPEGLIDPKTFLEHRSNKLP